MNSIPVPGDYVLLTVSDTGSGMEAETAAHLFEPFFTTKERGKGTGLGLATVYGIVRQNHGFITVYTEPDHGTVFKLYFPRHMDASEVETKPETTEIRAVTNGQILLVEDDELVRNMIANELLSLGYKALAARSAEEAVEICGNPLTRIDLVITDVVMPKMKGTELRERLLEMRPGLRVLFMSGYTANVIVRQGVLKSGIHFLQKPFTLDDLQTKIQQILSENEPL
jgi:CheY-like chemotaxis protein